MAGYYLQHADSQHWMNIGKLRQLKRNFWLEMEREVKGVNKL